MNRIHLTLRHFPYQVCWKPCDERGIKWCHSCLQRTYHSNSQTFYRSNLILSEKRSLLSERTLKYSLQNSFNVIFGNYFKRSMHFRLGKLQTETSPIMLYLHSLADEFKKCRDEQSDNVLTFKTKKEQKIYTLRYQFLESANEVISKIFHKQAELEELKALASDESNADMKEMIESEIRKIEKDFEVLEEELVAALAGEEPADNNDIIMEVSAGVGGQEAMLFCAELHNMYCQYGLRKGWTVIPISTDQSDIGGIRKATIEIGGVGVYKYLKYEAGIHRVQRVPKTERGGRIHTSTVSVSILPQPREIDVVLEKKDLKIETFRASGPGGQSVNTADSAVRVTHLPSGFVQECRMERLQHQNLNIAMKKLRTKMYQAQLEEMEENQRATRKMQVGSKGRSEKIRTYNYNQDRVTDHRVKENVTNLDGYMASGEGLDTLIASLDNYNKYQAVESMLDAFESSTKSHKSKV